MIACDKDHPLFTGGQNMKGRSRYGFRQSAVYQRFLGYRGFVMVYPGNQFSPETGSGNITA
jgi:hypothetical protein